MKNSKVLGLIVVMQGLILLGQWTGSPSFVAPARAEGEISNPGERQIAALEELKSLNGKMDKLLGLLEGGQVQVKVAKSDEGNKADAANK